MAEPELWSGDWLPKEPPATVEPQHIEQLAGSIGSLALTVDGLAARLAKLEQGPRQISPLAELDYLHIQSAGWENRVILSASGVDFLRMDWGEVGRAIAESIAREIVERGMYQTQFLARGTRKLPR